MTNGNVLDLSNLVVRTSDGTECRDIVKGINLSLRSGEILGLIGASGSGKTLTGLSLLNLLPPRLSWSADKFELEGADVSKLAADEWRRLRGSQVAMVFQDPLSSFNPVRKIGVQISEAIRRHSPLSKAEAKSATIEALAKVGIPSAGARFDSYPHELSGGMRQRAMIAMATVHNPNLLIADEPTTALDPTVKLQILKVLREELGDSAAILITHDLGNAATVCDRIVVMKEGKFVEEAPTGEFLSCPTTQYGKQLLDAVPKIADPQTVSNPVKDRQVATDLQDRPLIEAQGLSLSFDINGRSLVAVDDVSLSLARGETVGLVGESGSGKSSFLSMLIGLRQPNAGQVFFRGKNIADLTRSERLQMRAAVQFVFQDPNSSLNPRWSIRRILSEPLRAHGWRDPQKLERRCVELMELAELSPRLLDRRPSALSGGQKQRVSIMRALALEPSLIIADEPVSALDVLIQAEVVKLLEHLRAELDLGMLIVAHDLALLDEITQRLFVLYLGQVVEQGETQAIAARPYHPYTAMLRRAVVNPDRHASRVLDQDITGEPPSPLAPPTGCPFHPRCVYAQDRCRKEKPKLAPVGERQVACHFPIVDS